MATETGYRRKLLKVLRIGLWFICERERDWS